MAVCVLRWTDFSIYLSNFRCSGPILVSVTARFNSSHMIQVGGGVMGARGWIFQKWFSEKGNTRRLWVLSCAEVIKMSFSFILNKEIHCSERASILRFKHRHQLQGASPPWPHQGALLPGPTSGGAASAPPSYLCPLYQFTLAPPLFTNNKTLSLW